MKKMFKETKDLISPDNQSADFVELFFDLVFVFAVTKITHYTSHHLDIPHVLRAILIFWLIWWGWTQYTWTLNVSNTKVSEIRLNVLIATGFAFVMASSINLAFKDGVLWFAIPYIAIRILGMILAIRVSSNEQKQRSVFIRYALVSISGLIAVLVGALVSPNYRVLFWIAAIILDFIATAVGGRVEKVKIRASHFAERHGLIVIIALGESLIVGASALDSIDRSLELMIPAGLALVITCLLWWSYFSWISHNIEENFSKQNVDRKAQLARNAFSFMHFPIICGIVGIAIGFEKILSHPSHLLTFEVAISFSIGIILFLCSTGAALYMASKVLLLPRFVLAVLIMVGILFSVGQEPVVALLIAVVGFIFIVIIERFKYQYKEI